LRRNIWTFEHKRDFLEEENGKKVNFVRPKLVGCSEAGEGHWTRKGDKIDGP
jgi:hypothetical protein